MTDYDESDGGQWFPDEPTRDERTDYEEWSQACEAQYPDEAYPGPEAFDRCCSGLHHSESDCSCGLYDACPF